MNVELRQVGVERLDEYIAIPSRFLVSSVFRVEARNAGLGGLALREEAVDPPYWKDYDCRREEAPVTWTSRFDVSTWGFVMAFDGATAAGGAVVVFRSPGIHMLAGHDDQAGLWDIRVHPARWRQGIGGRLLQWCAAWARARGAVQLKIEAQNINVAACRFYAHMGCRLGAIDCHAYPPPENEEVMLLWYLDLRAGQP